MFVEVIQDDTALMKRPSVRARQIASLPAGEVFVYQDSVNSENRRWDKVKLGNNNSAWLARRIPPEFGVAEQQLTITRYFRFFWYDLYGFIISIFGFIWGFTNFKIRIG